MGVKTAIRRSRRLAVAMLVAALACAPPGTAAERTRPADPAATLQADLRQHYATVKAVLIWRGGCPLFEFYRAGVDADTRLPLYSVTKSVLSILLGLAIEHGDLAFDQTLGDFLPEAREPNIAPRVRGITVRQLMTMTAGFDAEAKPKPGVPPDLWRWSLARPLLSAPGQQFRYDNSAANLLSVMLTRRTGRTADDLARAALFEPMNIRNTSWVDDGDGHSIGAYGLWLTAREMAKIGVLYLRHGRWNGRQLVPDAYVVRSVSQQNAGGTPFRGAYGYLWWIKRTKTGLDAFFAAGSDGQLIYVVPRLDLVVVLASESTPPGGSVAFMNDIVLPVAAALAQRSCVPDNAGL